MAHLTAGYRPSEALSGDSMEELERALPRALRPEAESVLMLDLGRWPEKRRDMRFMLAFSMEMSCAARGGPNIEENIR